MDPSSNSKKLSFLQLLSKLLIPNESKPKLPEIMAVKKLQTYEPRIKSFKNLLQTNFETLKASDLISQAFKKEKFKNTTLNFIKERVNLNSGWKSKNSALVTKMKKLEGELDTQKKELKTINAEFDLKNNELDVTIIKLISQNKKLEAKNLELDSRNQNLMATNAELVARIKELEASNTRINDQKKEFEASNDDLNVRNLELEALNKELTTQTKDLKSSNAELTARTTKLDDQKKELETSNYKLAAKTKELEASNVKLTSQNKEFEAANAQLAAQKVNMDSTVELYAQIKKLKSFNTELAARLKKMIASNSGLAANKKDLVVSNDELDTKINKVENLKRHSVYNTFSYLCIFLVEALKDEKINLEMFNALRDEFWNSKIPEMRDLELPILLHIFETKRKQWNQIYQTVITSMTWINFSQIWPKD
ncbi:hypothetical protein Glove_24g58 [Diversispora epigaea]|uniref:Uncharacterized protein n=1 Tax=Diversispora epigaea TaxID=1348612 RepID=A0A397JST4_9GLOM|nr:hypothetical protein Glove_24g58 [Diversispora epigaea]